MPNWQRGQPRTLSDEEAIDQHACTRLRQRYLPPGTPAEEAYRVLYEHTAHVLAGDAQVVADWQENGRHLMRLEHEGGLFWIQFDPRVNRIITYLPPDPRFAQWARRHERHRFKRSERDHD